jgi:uncharacterized caspase-like protein
MFPLGFRSACIRILCALAFALLPHVGDAASTSRIALVIGNAHYGDPDDDLSGARRDANAVATALRDSRLDFTVTVKHDLTQAQLRKAVNEFAASLEKAGPSAIGFLYYAGHGGVDADQSDNFLIPVDVQGVGSADVAQVGYALRDVTERLKMVDKPAAIVVVIDACRTLVHSPGNSSARSALARMIDPGESSPGMLVALSTSNGSAASDSGRFASTLTELMLTGGLTVDQVFDRVRVDVARNTDRKQIPVIRSNIVEEQLCLVSCATGASSGPYAQSRELLEAIRKDAEQGISMISRMDAGTVCPRSWSDLTTMQSRADELARKGQADAAGSTYALIKQRSGELYEHLFYVRQLTATREIREQQYQAQLVGRQRDLEGDYDGSLERLQKAENRLQQHEKSFSRTMDRSEVQKYVTQARQLSRESKFEDANDRLVDAINAVNRLDEELMPGSGGRVLQYEKRRPPPARIENGAGYQRISESAQLCQ